MLLRATDWHLGETDIKLTFQYDISCCRLHWFKCGKVPYKQLLWCVWFAVDITRHKNEQLSSWFPITEEYNLPVGRDSRVIYGIPDARFPLPSAILEACPLMMSVWYEMTSLGGASVAQRSRPPVFGMRRHVAWSPRPDSEGSGLVATFHWASTHPLSHLHHPTPLPPYGWPGRPATSTTAYSWQFGDSHSAGQ